jgi:hypothetical protein
MLFGVTALTFMMLMYALERRGRRFIFAFGCGCLLSSAYGFLAGTWPFGMVEAIWAAIAFRRYHTTGVDEARTAAAAPSVSAPASRPQPLRRLRRSSRRPAG